MRNRKPREPHVICGAHSRRTGKPCRHPAGLRTEHPGEGRCYLHGGATPIKHGRYSSVRRLRIQELVEHFRNDPAPLDLLPEVHLLRALLTDFVERYDQFVDAMHAWHATYTKDYREAFGEWREKVISLTEDEGWRDTLPEDIPTAPDPLDFVDKPRQVLDISAAASLVDKVGAMVDRIERHKREGSISLETLDRVLEQLGMEVVHALKAQADDATRSRVIADLERRWASVRIDPSSRLKPRNSTDLN